MSNFSDSMIQKVWEKGTTSTKPEVWRKDACGAWINRSLYGQQVEYGWNIDHVYPEKKGGGNELVNLRPMHWENNNAKSDSYPSYDYVVTSEDNENVDVSGETRTVNSELQVKLSKLYNF